MAAQSGQSQVTILEKFNAIPPCVCRLLARKERGRLPLSHAEIARASGLSMATVSALSFRLDWSGVTVDVADRFARACGVNHLAAERQLEFVRRRKMVHVMNAPTNQRRFYQRLFNCVARIKR
jgi:hypothetical protein